MTNNQRDLDDKEFEAEVGAIAKELEAASYTFRTDLERLSNELDAELVAADTALNEFVTEIEKGDGGLPA